MYGCSMGTRPPASRAILTYDPDTRTIRADDSNQLGLTGPGPARWPAVTSGG